MCICFSHMNGPGRGGTFVFRVSEVLKNYSEDFFFFRNYVVQYILGLDITEVTANILAQFEGNILDLSMNKFSSHVVEKCLKELRAEYSTRIIVELISNPELFQNVVQDYSGNYVIQSALAVSQVTG